MQCLKCFACVLTMHREEQKDFSFPSILILDAFSGVTRSWSGKVAGSVVQEETGVSSENSVTCDSDLCGIAENEGWECLMF